MTSLDELRRRNEVLEQRVSKLRKRISKLSEASLRICASLDVRAALREVVDNARALTGARYGGIAIMGSSGECEEFVTSGFTRAEHRRMIDRPDAPRLFKHFRNLPGVLRLRDLHSYVRSQGFGEDLMPAKSFQGIPMHHRGSHVGNFFVCGKEGGQEFTGEDEEVLVMFAAQAAAAVANARAFRDEKQTRSDMEVLVDNSPVGVAVFDARTGKTLSLNQEAKRIVEGLRTPGCASQRLREVLTCRRADGQEISLKESSLARTLQTATRVRAEEIVLRVPDGRSVTTLMNADPIRAENGTVESVSCHRAGHGADRGTGADAGRVPGHGEPRAAGPADLHQRLDHHCVEHPAGPESGRDPRNLPPHRRTGRSHAEPDQRSVGCGLHRVGHTAGCPRTCAGHQPGGSGQEHVFERRGQRRSSRLTCPWISPR